MMAGREEQILPHMDVEGWHKRWKEGRIGWHKTEVDPVLEVLESLNHKAA